MKHNMWTHRWSTAWGPSVRSWRGSKVSLGTNKPNTMTPIDTRSFCPRVGAANALRITGDDRTHEATEEGTRPNLFQTGGTFSIVDFDFDVRGRFVTLGPSPNFHVTHSNEYKKRFRYSYAADGQRLSSPDLKMQPSHSRYQTIGRSTAL